MIDARLAVKRSPSYMQKKAGIPTGSFLERKMTIFKPIVAIALFFSVAALAMPAEAQRGYQIDQGPYVFSKETTSKKPRRGYSGWYPGPQQLFCDYERTPVRKCDSRGRCRVTHWNMKEYCY